MADQLDQTLVHLQLVFLVDRATEIERTFDLAAAEDRARLLAEKLLLRPQVLGHLELHVQVSMIDCAYFPRQGTDAGFH